MERDKSAILTSFLGDTLKVKSDPVGKLGRRQSEIVQTRNWKRATSVLGINLLGTYVSFPNTSYRSIGEVYGISGQRVQQVIEDTVVDLWKLAPTDLQKKYPRVKLVEGRISKLRGNGRLALELAEGGKSAREIKERINISSQELANLRGVLGRRSVELGYLVNRTIDVVKGLEEAKDDQTTQGLLNRIDGNMIDRIRQIRPGILKSVNKLVFEAGYHGSNRTTVKFVESLRHDGIPVGSSEFRLKGGKRAGSVIRYYFVASKDKDRVVKTIRRNHHLDMFRKNPVKAVYGPVPENVPTVWEVIKHRNLRRVRPILSTLGVHLYGGMELAGKNLFGKGSPVTIFKHQGGYYCREEDVPKLEKFIRRRLSELER